MKPIPTYPGYFLTDDFKIIGKKGKPLSMHFTESGLYQFCCVGSRDRSKKNEVLYLHRAIALVHVPGYFEGAVVDHIDRNSHNNNPSNLRWVTHRENAINCKSQKALNTMKSLGVSMDEWLIAPLKVRACIARVLSAWGKEVAAHLVEEYRRTGTLERKTNYHFCHQFRDLLDITPREWRKLGGSNKRLLIRYVKDHGVEVAKFAVDVWRKTKKKPVLFNKNGTPKYTELNKL